MADYKAIHGKNIQHLASDLDNAEGEGEIWFNTTTSDYKTITKAAGTWSTGGALNTGRQYFDAAGPQTASVAAGGWVSPGNTNASEEYNGTAWASGNNIATARRGARMAGVDSGSALMYGGIVSTPSNAVEGYDGTSWSSRPSLATARREGGRGKSGSTATSAFLAGGDGPPIGVATEEFTGAATAQTVTTS